MRFACSPVDSSFFQTAPLRYVHSAEITAPPSEVFAILKDHARWPEWFLDIKKVEVTSENAHSVGTTRTVTLATMVAYERFFLWEEGRRFSFYFDACTAPIASRFAEDYLVEDLPGGRCRFTYSVAITPTLLFKLGGPFARASLDRMFKKVPPALAQYVVTRTAKQVA